MEDEVKYLIRNLSTACNKIEENKITEQKIFTLKNEYNKKITGEDERVDRIFLEKLSGYDKKINEIEHYCQMKIDSLEKENSKLRKNVHEFKYIRILERTRDLDEEIKKTQNEMNSIMMNRELMIKKRNDKFLSSVILSDELYKWVSSIVIISFVGGFLVNIVLGLSHWIGTAAFVLGILCFRGKYRVRLKSVEARVKRCSDSYKALCDRKDIIIKKIDKESDVVGMVQKIDGNTREINSLSEEKNKLIDGVKREKDMKWRESSGERSREIESGKDDLTRKFSGEINELENRYKSNSLFLKNECEVTEEYQNEEILKKLISYLKNGRAFSKKSAIDLYEDEKRRDMEFQAKLAREREVFEFKKQSYEREMRLKEKDIEQNKEKNDREIKLKKEQIDRELQLKRKKMAQEYEIETQKMEQKERLEKQKIEMMKDKNVKFKENIESRLAEIKGKNRSLGLDEDNQAYKMRGILRRVNQLNKDLKEGACTRGEYDFAVKNLRSEYRKENERLKNYF